MRAFFLLFLVSWVLGIVVGVTGWVWLGGAGVILLFSAFRRVHLSWPHGLAGALLLILGWVYGGAVSDTPATSCIFGQEFDGTVGEVYRIREQDVQYVVRVGDCSVLATVDRWPVYIEGDRLHIVGEVQPLDEIPDEYAGYAQYLAHRDIYGTVRYPNVELVERSDTSFLGGLRGRLRGQVGAVFGEPEGSVVLAMVLGQKGLVPDSVTQNFRRTGVSHILAISGLHVSLIAGAIVFMFLFVPLPRLGRVLLSLAVLWGYVWLIGWPVSATRAGIFWTLVLLALELRWLISLPTVLILAAVGMVSAHPLLLFDAGFQLSFAAVVGIGLMLFVTKRGDLFSDVRRHPLVSLALVSLGATLTTWPIVGYVFGGVPVYGMFVNVLVVPFVPVLLGGAIVSLLLSFVAFPLAQIGALLVHVVWGWTNWVTSTVAVWPGAYVEVESIPLGVVWLYYAGLVWVADWVLKKQGRTWREVWE